MRKVIVVLLLLALVSTFLSCGAAEDTANAPQTSASAAETTTVAETTTADPFAGLPALNFDGYKFRMLIRNHEKWISDMYVETETGEVVDDAIYHRNAKVSERYNVEFGYTPSSNWNAETDAVKLILAGEDAYELIVPHPRSSFKYANQELCLDWNKDLKYVDLDNPWWDADARENLSINHKLFVMVGDISYQCLGAANVMLFNKTLFDDYKIAYPYEEALDGTWTFDKFEKIVKQGKKDLNGDSKYDKDNDQYGYVTQKWVGPIQALYVAGQRVLRKDKNDIPYLSINNKTTINTFEWYFSMIDSGEAYCQVEGTSWDGGFISIFTGGRSMFIDVNMADVATMRTMDADFGIIPWPKLDEKSEYCTNVDAGTNMFIVPITTPKAEMTSVILEALAAVGYYDVVPVYYSVALQTKFARDETSAGMLDIIKQSRVFDLGYYNQELTGTLGNHLSAFAGTEDRDFASWYAKNEPAALANLEKYVAVYKK